MRRAARQELESKRIEFVTEVFGDDKEAWVYFRRSDGHLYEMWQTQRPLKPLPAAGVAVGDGTAIYIPAVDSILIILTCFCRTREMAHNAQQ